MVAMTLSSAKGTGTVHGEGGPGCPSSPAGRERLVFPVQLHAGGIMVWLWAVNSPRSTNMGHPVSSAFISQ